MCLTIVKELRNEKQTEQLMKKKEEDQVKEEQIKWYLHIASHRQSFHFSLSKQIH